MRKLIALVLITTISLNTMAASAGKRAGCEMLGLKVSGIMKHRQQKDDFLKTVEAFKSRGGYKIIVAAYKEPLYDVLGQWLNVLDAMEFGRDAYDKERSKLKAMRIKRQVVERNFSGLYIKKCLLNE